MRIAMMTDSYFPTRDGVVTSICTIKESLEENRKKIASGQKTSGVKKKRETTIE